MLMLLAMLGLALAAALYLWVNAIVVGLLLRHLPPLLRRSRIQGKRFARVESRSVSNTRIWITVGAHLLSLPLFIYAILQPLSLLSLTTLTFAFTLLVSALTLSLLKAIPFVRKLWEDVFTKVALLSFPVYALYVARGYAGMWVGEVAGISAVNASSAFFAATALWLCFVVSALLFALTLAFEVALIALSALPKPSKRRIGFVVLSALSFFALTAASYAVLQFPSSRLGSRLIAAIVFEFDAAPATPCALSDHERRLTEGGEPFVKALYLSTTQDRALLIMRGPALFREGVLRELKSTDIHALLKPLRVVECFKPASPASDAASGASAPGKLPGGHP